MIFPQRKDSIRRSYIGLLIGLLILPLSGQTRPKSPAPDSSATLKAREYFYHGVLAQSAARTMEAVDLLRHARALDPTDPTIAFVLGGSYAQQGKSDRALPLLEEAYASDTTNMTFARTLSGAYIEAGRTQDALRINERLAAADPEDDDVRYRLIQLYARTGELKKGIELATQLQKRFRPMPSAYGQLTRLKIQLLALTKDSVAVGREYHAWADLYPDDRRPYYDWILHLFETGKVQEAERQITADLRRGRISSGDATALRVHKHIILKDYTSAEAELVRLTPDRKIGADEKLTLWLLLTKSSQGSEGYTAGKYTPHIADLLRAYPDDLQVLKTYTQLLRYEERYREAYDLLAPKRHIYPHEEWLWSELLDAASGLSSDSLLVEVAQEAKKYVPTDWRNYIVLAGDAFQKDNHQRAIQLLEEGIAAIEPKTGEGAARLYGLLADLYAEHGGPSKASLTDSLYLRAIEANPKEVEVLNNYAYRLAKAGRNLEAAERYALQAVRLSPDAAHILDTYAYILLLRKNYTLAKLYQRKALSQSEPDKISADMYDHMGDIYRALDDYDAALTAWQQALTALPEKAEKAERTRIEKKIREAKKAQKK